MKWLNYQLAKLKDFLKFVWWEFLKFWLSLKKRVRIVLITLLGLGIALGATIDSPIPQNELLKTDKANVIASRIIDDKVQYAFKNGFPDDRPFQAINGTEITRTPYGKLYKIDAKTYVAGIFSGPPQYFEENNVWHQVDYATTTKKSFERQTGLKPQKFWEWSKAYAQTSTSSFSEANGDGSIQWFTDNTAWATMHDSVCAGGDAAACTNGGTFADSSGMFGNIQRGTSNNMRVILRSVWPFRIQDMMPAGQSVTSSTLVFTSNADGKTDTWSVEGFLSLVQHTNTTSSLTSLAIYDYSYSLFATGTVLAPNMSIDTYNGANNAKNSFLLNSSGWSVISTQTDAATTTVFGTLINDDRTNIEPTGEAASARVSFNGYASDQAGTSADPILYVLFQAAAAAPTVVIPNFIIIE